MNMKIFLLVVVSCSLSCPVHATQYIVTNTVPNTVGGQFFDKEIGVQYALQIMPAINQLIFNLFEEQSANDRRDVPVINVYITEFSGYAFESGFNSINVSASTLYEYFYPCNQCKSSFYSMLAHEMTHVFQWDGTNTAPEGLMEGIADYVMVKCGYFVQRIYSQPGDGKKWDEGYGVTERFLEYCDSLLNGFTAKLNKMMRYKYDEAYWVQLLGKPVDQLWREYKAKYGNRPQQDYYSTRVYDKTFNY